MSAAAEAALRHVRDEMGWPGARIPEVRPEPGGTALAVACARDDAGVRWCWGVRIGRGGEVLDDAVLVGNWPPEENDKLRANVTKGRTP